MRNSPVSEVTQEQRWVSPSLQAQHVLWSWSLRTIQLQAARGAGGGDSVWLSLVSWHAFDLNLRNWLILVCARVSVNQWQTQKGNGLK